MDQPGLSSLGVANESAGGYQGDDRGPDHLETHPVDDPVEDEPAVAGGLMELAFLVGEKDDDPNEDPQVGEDRTVLGAEQTGHPGTQPQGHEEGWSQTGPLKRHQAILGKQAGYKSKPDQPPNPIRREGQQQHPPAERC